jgi:hypothetical protein
MVWKDLALVKFFAINVIPLFGVMLMIYFGVFFPIFAADPSYISHVIVAVFLLSQIILFYRLFLIRRDINFLERGIPPLNADFLKTLSFGDGLKMLEERATVRLSFLSYLIASLVVLGLIGTLVGFILLLQGITPSMVGDITKVSELVALIARGMGIALVTTLIGSVLNLWARANFVLLVKTWQQLNIKTMEHVFWQKSRKETV